MVSETKESSFHLGDHTEDIIQHLTFHKSIIDEKRNGERIDDYIKMIEEMDDGEKELSDDPLDNAIASIFKLVIEEKMDPWEIDLVSFTQLYLEQAKEKDGLNFIVTGQLVNMAWSILKMQCEKVLSSAEKEEGQETQDQEEDFFTEWDMEIYEEGIYEEPEDIDFEEEIVEDEKTPLEKAVRREEKKPVSLIQLVDAFEDAKREAKYREKMEKIRKEKKRKKEEELKERKENYETRSHEEDLQSDISTVWKRICCYEQKFLTFNMIHDDRKKDIITALTSLLFLNKEGRINIKQLDYPNGQILLENLVPKKERQNGLMELVPETQNEALTIIKY